LIGSLVNTFPTPEKEWTMSETKTFTKDPTCGMDVDEATALQSVRDGKTYYFCSDKCQKTFLDISTGVAKTCSESLPGNSKTGPVANPIPGQSSAGASVPAQSSQA
jgi:YHS domain-containing protein